MKRLTDSDLAFLDLLWSRVQLGRPDLATCDQRTADRLAAAGIVQKVEQIDRDPGIGWGERFSPRYFVYTFDPDLAARYGDAVIVAQLAVDRPDLLRPRPLGAAAQAQIRLLEGSE